MADIRLLLKELNGAAAQGAQDGMVCGFQLATVCQDFLLAKNVSDTVAKDAQVSCLEMSWWAFLGTVKVRQGLRLTTCP